MEDVLRPAGPAGDDGRAGTELFSVAVLYYRSGGYIFEALDSVLRQDYPRVELIVASDGDPDFDEESVRAYIGRNKTTCVERVIVRSHPQNLGTVANAEWCRRQAQGKYFMLLAADDALYDERVLSRFAAAFAADSGIWAACADMYMCGTALSERLERVPDGEGAALLRSGDTDRLFARLCYDSFIPTTSTCLRAALFKRLGGYDTSYRLIEDATLFIRMAREGYRFGWVDGVGALHRDGGVSHSGEDDVSETERLCRLDEMRMYQKEIRPFLNKLRFAARCRAVWKAEIVKCIYEKKFLYRTKSGSLRQRIRWARQVREAEHRRTRLSDAAAYRLGYIPYALRRCTVGLVRKGHALVRRLGIAG